jgi:hypothetical protein
LVALPLTVSAMADPAAAFSLFTEKGSPLVRQSLLALRVVAAPGTATVASNCASQARNSSMFEDRCLNIMNSLSGIGGAITSSNVNQTGIDQVCKSQCFQRFVNYLRAWTQCLQQNNIPTSFSNSTGAPPSPQSGNIGPGDFESGVMTPLVNMLNAVARMFCQKNEQGIYCITQIKDITVAFAAGGAAQISVPSGPSGAPSGNGKQTNLDGNTFCPVLQKTGCCLGALMTTMSEISAMAGESSVVMTNAMGVIKNFAKNQCQLTVATSCTPEAGKAAKLKGAAKLSLLWDWWNSQTAAKQAAIKNALCTDLAAAGAFYSDQCSILSVAQSAGGRRLLAASTTFEYQVLGMSTNSLQGSQSALSGNVPFNDVSAASGQTVSGSSDVQSIQAADQASSAMAVAGNALTALLIALVAALAL